MAALSMGAQCSPTPPGCDAGAGCPGETLQTRSCIDFCAPLWPGPDADPIGRCALDECDRVALAAPDVWRCPNGFACTRDETSPDPARLGRCRATYATFLTACTPPDLGLAFSAFACSSGTFCMPLERCPDRVDDLPGRWTARGVGGVCMLPAREGELCDGNLADDTVTCRRCEWGTFCRDTTSGPRCMRPCTDPEDPSVPQPGRCPCGAVCQPWSDLAPPSPMFDVRPGEPEHYCTIRCVENGTSCERIACCDPLAQCSDAEDHAGIPRPQCCRGPGSACDTGDDCCRGYAECIGGVCTPCGREGDPVPQAGCCGGYAAIQEGNRAICRSCATSAEGRELAYHGACEGHFVQLFDTDGRTDTFAVPRNGSTGAGPAEMPRTTGDVQRVRYRLSDDHRLFLMQGDLTRDFERFPCAHPPDYYPQAGGECAPGVPYPAAGITVGHRYVQLPANFPGGGPREVDLSALSPGPSTWQSLRVYDSGACSTYTEWARVGDVAVAGINTALVDPAYSSALRLDENRISPILASGSGLFARGSEQDQVNAFFEYTAVGGAAGCGSATRIRFHTALQIRRLPASLPTAEVIRMDREILDPEPRPCRTAVLPGSGPCEETCFRRLGDQYACNQVYPEAGIAGVTALYPRPVRHDTDTDDFLPELLYADGGVVDCAHALASSEFRGRIEGAVRRAFPGLVARFTESLDVDALTVPGVTLSDLVDCGELDGRGRLVPNRGICAEASPPLFGGRRHGCRGYNEEGRRDDQDPTQFRCSALRIEIRRINLRPDGLEFVLVNDASDPQLPLVQAAFPEYCRADRLGSLADGEPLVPAAIPGVEGLSSLPHGVTSGGRTICGPRTASLASDGTVTGCRGICGDVGVPCEGLFYAEAFRPDRPDVVAGGPGVLQCYVFDEPDEAPWNTCCHRYPPPIGAPGGRLTMCPWPELVDGARSGRRLLNLDGPRMPGDFYSCRDLDSDRRACGACDNACADGWACCGSTCVDVRGDPAHCGGCGHVCSADRPACVSGACACSPPLSDCDGSCVDLSTDLRNCGTCGASCVLAGSVCLGGECVLVGEFP